MWSKALRWCAHPITLSAMCEQFYTQYFKKDTLKGLALFLLVFFQYSLIHAQGHVDVFPGVEGKELLQLLRKHYKPATVLDYRQARIKMYTEIYNENDTVYGVYTRYGLYLPPDVSDPIGWLIRGGSDYGINTEHTFPQSKGARYGNARSDMHHLFPAMARVNEARSNYPFGEIDDQRTRWWFYKDKLMYSIPKENIDAYSEGIEGMFEPREDHKGNVARAMFYFMTMYRSQADAAFFQRQRKTLCQWHYLDPVDSLEWTRNLMIAAYQDGKPNPFILDCSLAKRTYCQDVDRTCMTHTRMPNHDQQRYQSTISYTQGVLHIQLPHTAQPLQLFVFDSAGKMFAHKAHRPHQNSNFTLPIALPSGAYIVVVHFKNATGESKVIRQRLIVL